MATAFSPTTPSPPPDLPTPPPAPRFGAYHDDWDPYRTRKSARISSQRGSDRTPSPRNSNSNRTLKKENQKSQSSMVSPAASPQKRQQPPTDYNRRVSGSLTAEGTATAAAALGLNPKSGRKQTSSSTSHPASMLPTPSKTPQKPPTAKAVAEIDTFARNLFPSDEEASSSSQKRRAKRYSGMTMDSFRAEDVEESFEIFTDSQDRVPQKDESISNPFWGAGARHREPSKRRGQSKQVAIPGEGLVSVEEAVRRQDGMLLNFRGKRIFRKYSENDAAQSDDREAEEGNVETGTTQYTTRSSITPRILFPKKQDDNEMEDEEATTDVEDAFLPDVTDSPRTPTKALQDSAPTPSAPRFAPISPPDTKRITRSTNKLATEAVKSESSRCSPFDAWRRTKDHAKGQAEKRHAEPVNPSNAKRTRT